MVKKQTARQKIAAKPKCEDIVEIFDKVEQGSEEWLRMRLGIPTASNFLAICATPRDPDSGGMRRKLLYLMAAEILADQPMATFSNYAMARGKDIEPRALDHYAFTKGVDVRRVGFVRRTIASEFADDLVVGASPDGLVDDDGGIEIKRMQADLVVELLNNNTVPEKHKAQVQGNLWVSGRQWCDLVVYPDPLIPIVPIFRFYRDDIFIDHLKDEVDRFVFDLRHMVDGIRKRS